MPMHVTKTYLGMNYSIQLDRGQSGNSHHSNQDQKTHNVTTVQKHNCKYCQHGVYAIV